MMDPKYYYIRGDRCYYLTWAIPTFDESAENPFPLKNRCHALDWSGLTEDEVKFVVKRHRFDEDPNIEDLPNPDVPAFDNAIEQIGTVIRNDRELVKLRKHFKPITDEEYKGLFENPPLRLVGSACICPSEYFEDTSGKEVTHCGMINTLLGPGHVIHGDIESVISLGTSPISQDKQVSEEESNLLHHFVSVIEQIASSNWVRSPSSFTVQGRRQILSAEFPLVHDTRSVLVLFRQLYSTHKLDNLFMKATATYCDCVADERKKIWVKAESDRFEATLNQQPLFELVPGVTNLHLLDAFSYGYKVMHAKSLHDEESKLKSLIKLHGPERFLFAFDLALRSLWQHIHAVYYPLHEDLKWWVKQGYAPEPTLLDLRQLIGI